jgi:hypothetical protein
MSNKPMDFPLESLKPTLRRLTDKEVPHASRLLDMIERNPHMRWSDLGDADQAIIQGWSLHLVGLLRRLHDQLQRVKRVVVEASQIEKDNPYLSRDALTRIADHHGQSGDPDRANAFRLAAALRTPAPSNDPA